MRIVLSLTIGQASEWLRAPASREASASERLTVIAGSPG